MIVEAIVSLTLCSFFEFSEVLDELPSDLMCKELQLGLGETSLVVLAMELTSFGDCEGSRVRLLTNALVSLCVEPQRFEVPLSAMPPDTRKIISFVN
jgi:hypothetical protein